MIPGELYDFTVAVGAPHSNVVIIDGSPEVFTFFESNTFRVRASSIKHLPDEPGVYAVIARFGGDESAIAYNWWFTVVQYERCRVVPSGAFVVVPEEGK